VGLRDGGGSLSQGRKRGVGIESYRLEKEMRKRERKRMNMRARGI
jgi:hypothetical protein